MRTSSVPGKFDPPVPARFVPSLGRRAAPHPAGAVAPGVCLRAPHVSPAESLRPPMATEPSRILFETPLVQVGKFRCPTSHPRFTDSGPTKTYCFVFPRTAVWIQHEGTAAFVADPTIVPLYNPGHPYRRGAISRDGDRTDWFGVSAGVLREALATHGSRAAEAEWHLFQRGFARATPALFVGQRRVFERVQAADAPDPLYVEESVITLLEA